ncbi:two-component response regulator ARR14-like [Forsythia ovata]|uniref:Two-component response regulator ARR14-like n=1 Tax=Forsythia ovata TaxID=205694 RepID=A0ABD1TUN5_9LAMI
MSIDDNAFLAMGALKNGAFLFIKKPVTMDMLKCLWQHVVRERMRIQKENDRIMGMAATNNHSMSGVEFRGEVEEENNIIVGNNNYKGKKRKRARKSSINGIDEECESEPQLINNKVKRKECIQWTQLLHSKFMDAVEQLGEGRCFPKEILELMDVPGLTRMQVSSHLQKFRNDNWRAPEERKSKQNNAPAASTDTNISGQSKPRRFGSMPCLKKNSLPINERRETHEGSEVHTENDEMPNDGYESITIEPIIMNSNQQYHEQLVSGPNNSRPGANSSSNPRFPYDDFFNFPENIDCLFQNFSGMQQGFDIGMNMNESSDPEQNSALPSVKTRSQWSSETSNFASNSSETRGQEIE